MNRAASMEYGNGESNHYGGKIMTTYFMDMTPNQQAKFRLKIAVEIGKSLISSAPGNLKEMLVREAFDFADIFIAESQKEVNQ